MPVFLGGTHGLGSYFGLENDKLRIEAVEKKCFNDDKNPSFVYLHSMLLHFPFCLDNNLKVNFFLKPPPQSNNNITNVLDNIKINMSNQEKQKFTLWRSSYINHLRKLNQLILPLVNSIKKNDSNAIIVILSDHGSRLLCDINFVDARKEGFENVSYVYFPDRNYTTLNQNMTPTELMKAVQLKCLGK